MSEKALLPGSKSPSAHCLSSSHCSTDSTHGHCQDVRVPLSLPCLLQPKQALSPAEFTWGSHFYSSWVSAGMGTEQGSVIWICPQYPSTRWVLPLPTLAVLLPGLCQAVPGCAVAPAQFAASCFLAQLPSSSPGPVPARGSPLLEPPCHSLVASQGSSWPSSSLWPIPDTAGTANPMRGGSRQLHEIKLPV